MISAGKVDAVRASLDGEISAFLDRISEASNSVGQRVPKSIAPAKVSSFDTGAFAKFRLTSSVRAGRFAESAPVVHDKVRAAADALSLKHPEDVHGEVLKRILFGDENK